MTTVDELRERLRKRMAAVVGPCPKCNGSGVTTLAPAMTQADVAKALGIQRTSVTNFLNGKQGFTMPATLRLLDFLLTEDAT